MFGLTSETRDDYRTRWDVEHWQRFLCRRFIAIELHDEIILVFIPVRLNLRCHKDDQPDSVS